MASADNAAKRRRLGARVSPGQFALLLDYLLANPVLVRAATDSPLSKEEPTALWDIIVRELNVEGPSVKSRAEWKAFWNARVCAARRRDLDLSGATQRTGGGVNPVPPLSAEEEGILSLVGTDSSRGCGGRRLAPVAPRTTPQPDPSPQADPTAAATDSPAEDSEAEDTPEAALPGEVAAAPPQNVHQPPCALPPRSLRARPGQACTARDLLAAQQQQLAAQLQLLAAQQGIRAALEEILRLQRGATDALGRLTSAVEGLAAAGAQQSASLTTLVLHLMGVRNLNPRSE
ncbi:hypothetical protein ISCGN_019279 [Ixodes scapularis]